MPALIVIGDKTSHGGTVIGGSSTTDTHGKRIARVGDMTACPKKGHGTCPIVTGDPTLVIDGMPAARHGDKTACGATLIAAQMFTTDDPGTGFAPSSPAAEEALSGRSPFVYDEQTHLAAQLIAGVPYFIETKDGRTYSGRISERGLLPRIETAKQDDYTVYWGDEALSKAAEGAE